MRLTLVWTGTALILLLAIGLATSPVGAMPVVKTGTPSPRGLFEDDFATYSRRWQEKESAKWSVSYAEGALVLRVVSPGVVTWSVPDFEAALGAYRAEATFAVTEDSAPDSLAGLVVNYRSDDDFYAVLVNPAGDWSVRRMHAGDWEDLTPLDAEPLSLAPSSALRLWVEVHAGQLTLAINDEMAASVEIDDDLLAGTIGLVAQAGHGYVEVVCDDMQVVSLNGSK